MRGLLEFVVRGRITAMLVATGCAVSILIPLIQPLCILTGVVVALVTLRHGIYEGFFVLAGTVGLFVVFVILLVNMYPPLGPVVWFVAVLLLLSWSWSWLMAGALARASGQGHALMVGAILGLLTIFAFPVLVSDSTLWWEGVFDALRKSIRLQAVAAEPLLLDQLIDVFRSRASAMTGVAVSGVTLLSILMLLVARWWHSILDNPGGFSREFRQLRLSRWISVVVLATLFIAYFGQGSVSIFSAEIYSILRVLFVFQGLAVVHALVAQTGAWGGWLIIMYVMAVLVPQMTLILATTGFFDTWFDFRKRVPSRTP